jgi:hypothetical protein
MEYQRGNNAWLMYRSLWGNAGSASFPGYSFNVDTNTGMYRVGADELGFATGGSLRGLFNATGIFLVNSQTTSGGGLVQLNTWINMFQQAGDPSVGTNRCHIYGKDVAGTTEVFVQDEGGVASQISPHDPLTGEYYQYSIDRKTGTHKRVWMERLLDELVEQVGINKADFFEEWVNEDDIDEAFKH